MFGRKLVTEAERAKSTAKQKLRRIRRLNEKSANTAHIYSNIGILVIASMAMFGMSYNDIMILLHPIKGQGPDMGRLVPLLVIFISIVVMNYGQMCAARNRRRSESRGEPIASIDSQIMYGVLGAESVSFGYALYLIDKPSTAIAWILIAIRSLIFCYVVMYLEMQREHAIDTIDMITQAEIGQGYGMLDELVDRAYDTDIPLALRMQSYQATATLHPDMALKLSAIVAASQAQDTFKKDGTIIILNKDGAPLTPAVATPPLRSGKAVAREAISVDEKKRIAALIADDPNVLLRTVADALDRPETTVFPHFNAAKSAYRERNTLRSEK